MNRSGSGSATAAISAPWLRRAARASFHDPVHSSPWLPLRLGSVRAHVHGATGRLRAFLSRALVVGVLLQPGAARAEESQLARHELWLSVSASLLLGGIAGSFALKAAALEDRIGLLPLGSSPQEPFELKEDALNTRRWAWGFGAGASLMAVTSLFVLLYQPAIGDKKPVINPVLSANQLGVSCHGRF